jgi:tol-pal system protein YbgF
MIKPSLFRCAAIAIVLTAWLPLQASAGLLSDDEARKAILVLNSKLDEKLRDINALVGGINARIDTKGDRTVGLEMLNQLEQIMRELASVRGEVEVLAHEVTKVQNNQKDLYADLDARIKMLEPSKVAINGPATDALAVEKKSYDIVEEVFKAGDYKGAVVALQSFLRLFPNSAYAADAQFLLANAYFGQGNYKNAIAAHEALLATYGDSPNAPEAMLNIAASFSQLNDKKNAKKSLQRLISTYAGSKAANIGKERLAQQK